MINALHRITLLLNANKVYDRQILGNTLTKQQKSIEMNLLLLDKQQMI